VERSGKDGKSDGKSERLEPSMPCHTIPGHAGHDVSKGIFLSSCLFQALACFSLYVAGSSRHCCAFVIASSTSTYMFFFSSFFFFFFFLLLLLLSSLLHVFRVWRSEAC
jgi:hypothetical protein